MGRDLLKIHSWSWGPEPKASRPDSPLPLAVSFSLAPSPSVLPDGLTMSWAVWDEASKL